MKDLLLVRLAAELTIKSNRTRAEFVRRLTHNIRDALDSAELEYELERAWDRIYVRADAARAEPVLARLPGISSVSFVERTVPAELSDIVASGEELFRERV